MKTLPETFKMCDVPEELLKLTKTGTFRKALSTWFTKIMTPNVYLEEDVTSEKELHLKHSLQKHKQYQKKRKHVKDKPKLKDSSDPWFNDRDKYGKCKHVGRGFRVVHRGQFKHLRSQKVFLEEEYYDTDPSNWYDEWFHDPYELDYCNYIMEMCNHEWEDYVDESGRVLEKYEIIEQQLEEECCYYCGNYGCDGSCIIY